MKKTAEQAAENAANEYMNSKFKHYQDIGWSDAEFAFIAGAAWQAAQNQWIKINSEKDLPDYDVRVNVVCEGRVDSAIVTSSLNGYKWIWDVWNEVNGTITHWQPLPKPPIE